jgi:hypothetical protein
MYNLAYISGYRIYDAPDVLTKYFFYDSRDRPSKSANAEMHRLARLLPSARPPLPSRMLFSSYRSIALCRFISCTLTDLLYGIDGREAEENAYIKTIST